MTAQTLTFADVIARLLADPNPPRRRGQMISALRTVARLLNADPAAVPAEPNPLRKKFESISPTAAGMRRGRWYNVRSLTLSALKHAGIQVMRGRAHTPLAADWELLRAGLADAKSRHGLSRLMSFCTERGVSPGAVDAATFAQFKAALENDSIVRKTKTVYRTACVLWNQAAASIPGWPSLSVPVPSASRRYALDWSDFPDSFRSDAEAFLYHPKHSGIFSLDYAKPVKPSTTHLRHKQIPQIATALVCSGFPIERITSLAVLVERENAERALAYFYTRNGERLTKYLHQQALLIKTIARHWVKASPEQIEALGAYCRNLAVKNTGMTSKNRARLRQFDNVANVDALLGLPSRVVRQIQRDDRGRRQDALRILLALAIEFLAVAPIRIANLTGLEIERHLVWIRAGGDEVLHLVIPPEEVKNDEPYEMELPKETVEMLQLYLAKYRPRLISGPCPWLFPNANNGRRHSGMFGTAISRFIFEETGVRMNVHLFRHFAVKLHLDANPDDMETARRLLGHKSITTTLKSYSENKTGWAFRRFDKMIGELRENARRRDRRPDNRRKS